MNGTATEVPVLWLRERPPIGGVAIWYGGGEGDSNSRPGAYEVLGRVSKGKRVIREIPDRIAKF